MFALIIIIIKIKIIKIKIIIIIIMLAMDGWLLFGGGYDKKKEVKLGILFHVQ